VNAQLSSVPFHIATAKNLRYKIACLVMLVGLKANIRRRLQPGNQKIITKRRGQWQK
jgi:hypothetical protein